MPPTAIAIAILDDLLFTARIRETARALGVELLVVRDPSVLHQGPPPALLLLDLNSKRVDPFAALEVVRQRLDGGKSAPAVAFAAAMDKELADRAKSAGLEQVFDRGAFTEKLPEILRSVVKGPPSNGTG